MEVFISVQKHEDDRSVAEAGTFEPIKKQEITNTFNPMNIAAASAIDEKELWGGKRQKGEGAHTCKSRNQGS